MTDFKPGDVVVHPDPDLGRGIVEASKYVEFETGTTRTLFEVAPDLRRLVVIDPALGAIWAGTSTSPEGRVHRFLTDLSRSWGEAPDELKMHGGTALIDWLASHFEPAPVKPPEPTGLGAVVVDAAGVKWVQFLSRSGWWWKCLAGENRRWSDLDVRTEDDILSEGVPS